MSTAGSQLVSFAGTAVSVEYDGPRAAGIVDFLYRYAPAKGQIPPYVTYRLTLSNRPARLELCRGDTRIYEGESDVAAAELLLGDSCHHLAKHSNGGLLFHAAALAWDNKGLLMPGRIGAGKTTIAAWLATRGLRYLTDELVFVPESADSMQTFTRPLNLKHPAEIVLQDHIDLDRRVDLTLRDSYSCLISPALLGPADTPDETPVSLIIFPHYRPGSDLALLSLSKAQTGLALMQCLVNARNLPDHGFPEITRLARVAPAYHMRYGSFGQIEGQVETLLRSV